VLGARRDRSLLPSEREHVLQALAQLCAERGYEQLGGETIAERAGINAEAFAQMFADVEECMVAALNSLSGQVLAEVSSVYSADRSEWESGILGTKAVLELMAARPSFAYLGFIAARQMATPHVAGVGRTGRQLLAVMIKRLWEYSELKRQPGAAASAALGGCEAVVRRELIAGRCEELADLLPDFIYAATVPFLGQEEALRLARQGGELLDEDRGRSGG
jgi:hypothetical protein